MRSWLVLKTNHLNPIYLRLLLLTLLAHSAYSFDYWTRPRFFKKINPIKNFESTKINILIFKFEVEMHKSKETSVRILFMFD